MRSSRNPRSQKAPSENHQKHWSQLQPSADKERCEEEEREEEVKKRQERVWEREGVRLRTKGDKGSLREFVLYHQNANNLPTYHFMPYLGCNRTRWHKIMDKMFCQPSALKYQKEKRNETKCGESLRWEKKHKKGGEPRHWDRGSEYGVIESAKGGGLGGGGWGRSWRNAGMIESEYIKTHWEFSSVSFHLCPSLLISKGWQDPYLYTTYRVPSHQSAKEAQEKWKGMKRRKVESKKKIESDFEICPFSSLRRILF